MTDNETLQEQVQNHESKLEKHDNKLVEHDNKLQEQENKLKNHTTEIKKLKENIRTLEESDIRQQIQLANIEKSQSEIKLMINENSREQQKTLEKFTEIILQSFTNQIQEKTKIENEMKAQNNKTDNNIKFYNTKQFWIILGTLATAIGAAIGHLFK